MCLPVSRNKALIKGNTQEIRVEYPVVRVEYPVVIFFKKH